MTIRTIVAIAVIYLIASGGWAMLGKATSLRSTNSERGLQDEIDQHWGGPVVQPAPTITSPEGPVLAATNTLLVHLESDPRQKGLIWYPTFRVNFTGKYQIANTNDREVVYQATLTFPQAHGTYESLVIAVNGERIDGVIDTSKQLTVPVAVAAKSTSTLTFAYKTRGSESWSYKPGATHGRVRNFQCHVTTNFTNIDFLPGSWTAMHTSHKGDGTELTWSTEDLLTHQSLGVICPAPLNRGPVTSRIIFFAPVCLGFFFLLVATIAIVRHIPVHPMHYLFVAGGFFSFHLLLSYLVDHLSMPTSFAISAITAVTLVTCYLRQALGGRLPLFISIGSQIFFLVLFSYSFLWQGMTGLVVACGCVVTLAVFMALTANLDWNTVFARDKQSAKAPTTPLKPEPITN